MITDLAGNTLDICDTVIAISRHLDKYEAHDRGTIVGLRQFYDNDGLVRSRVCVDLGVYDTDKHWFEANRVVKVNGNR